MTKIKWHRHYWCPWGYAIGFNDVAFVTVGGRTFEIQKFFFMLRVNACMTTSRRE